MVLKKQKKSLKGKIASKLNLHESTAKKKLTSSVILFILINSILGSSLFYLPSLGVKSFGAASLISWALVFMIAGFIMMYIGELVTLFPTSGGTYFFCKKAYGRFIAFFAGWLIWIAGNFAMALNIVAAAEYFIPSSYANFFILRLVFAAIWIIALNYMAFRGIDAGVTMLVAFGMLTLVVVTAIILPSFINIPSLFSGFFTSTFDFSLMHPFFREAGFGIFTHLLLSLLLLVEAFFGFEAITYLSNEAENPKKLPKLLLLAMLICGAIVALYIFSSLGIVNYHDYVTDARPWALQALNNLGATGQNIVVFGMYLVIIGAAAAWPITSARLIQAMARDKLFLKHFAKRHHKHNSPYRAVYFQAIAITLFTWMIFRGYLVKWGDPYRTAYLTYVILTLIVISLIIFAVPILRRKHKDLARSFKARLPLLGPIAITLFFIVLIVNWVILEGSVAWAILSIAGSLIILGLPFYFMVEMYYDPKAIVKVNEILSYFVLATERIHFPLSIRSKIIKSLGNLKGETILEYGCNIGSLTKRLAPRVGRKGKIIATDIALHNVNITDRRTKLIPQVFVHYHPHLNDFKLKISPKVDEVISIGVLSYMQNPKRLLTSLGKRVKKGADVAFVDYDKFFHIIPNVTWISDDKQLIKLFKNAGFEVTVERKRSLLWTYVIIKGKKV